MRPDEGPKGRLTEGSVYPKRPPFRNPFPCPASLAGGCALRRFTPAVADCRRLGGSGGGGPAGFPRAHALGDMRMPLMRLKWSEARRGMTWPAAIPGMNLTVEPAAATIASVSVGTATLTGRPGAWRRLPGIGPLYPHFSPGDVIMAQEFFPQRVLASEERSRNYGRGSMCALRGKGPARARPAPSVPASPYHGANQSTEDKLLFIMVPATR